MIVFMFLLLFFACNDKKPSTHIILNLIWKDSILCENIAFTQYYARVKTSKLLEESDFKIIRDTLNMFQEMVYFHLPGWSGASEEYGWISNDNETFYLPNFSSQTMKEQLADPFGKNKKQSNEAISEKVSGIDDPDFAKKAFIISRDFIKQNLTSPKSANFSLLDYKYSKVIDNTITIQSFVDSKNEYNVEIRKQYTIKLLFLGGDWSDINNWKMLDLSFSL